MSYIGISPEGVPSIYDIKVSRKPFKNWHSAKVITEDYKLGINKQLLENIANTSMSSLSIVPVIFPEKDGKIDANAFYIDNLEDRSRADSKSGLEQGGKITEALIKLIPAKIKLDETQSNDLILLNKEVLGIMYPKYDFRTKVRINDVKHIFESAVKSSKGHSVLSIYDAIDHVKLTSPNTPEGKVEFEAKVKDYVERAAKAEHSQVLDLVKAILTAKSGSSEDKRNQEIKFGRRSIELQNMFNKYLSDE